MLEINKENFHHLLLNVYTVCKSYRIQVCIQFVDEWKKTGEESTRRLLTLRESNIIGTLSRVLALGMSTIEFGTKRCYEVMNVGSWLALGTELSLKSKDVAE